MGYLSCNAESAISTCDSYNFNFNFSANSNKKKKKDKNRFEIRDFRFEDLQSATNGFSQANFLGKGSHGSVFRAVFHGGDQEELIAAVKRTTNHHHHPPENGIGTPAENEIETLSRVRSPRLVNLIGFGSDPVDGRKLIVVEYMPNGSLYDLLHNNRTGNKPAGLAKRVKIAVQVAKAVHHLHSSNPPVIHRDIKSSNVLFDRKWTARLGDFGLALRGHVEDDARIQRTPPAGTLGYLDPCYLAPGDLSSKNDVFSFGILLLEIFSGRNAIDLRYSPPSVVDWAAPLIRSGEYGEVFDPEIEISPEDSAALRELAVLAARCVKSTAEKRPEMAEVVECLIAAGKKIRSPVWGRRRVRLTQPSLIERNEMVVKGLTKRSRKVSSGATSVQLEVKSDGGDCIDSCHASRSRSIGSVHDIKSGPLDLGLGRRRGQGLGVKGPIVVMSRSKSTGELQRLVNSKRNGGGIVLQMIKNPNVRELESSKLLVKLR